MVLKNKSTKNLNKKSSEYEDITNNKNMPTSEELEPVFSLLDLYFESNKQILVKHHIDSFNQFIEEIIPNVLQSGENIITEKIMADTVIRHRLQFDNLGISSPYIEESDSRMYPLDAIQKTLSYSSHYYANVTQFQDVIDINTGSKTTTQIAFEPNVPIGKIPIMVGSKYCNLIQYPEQAGKHCKYDAGGYFIIGGSEKLVLSIETMILRKPLVFTQRDQNNLVYYVRVHSRPATQFVGNIQIFTIRMKKDDTIVVFIPRFHEVSIFVLMRALGLETDIDIINSIVNTQTDSRLRNQLAACLYSSGATSMTRDQAIEILITKMKTTKDYSQTNADIRAQQKRKDLEKILIQQILPHVTSGTGNTDLDMIYKAYYIGYMVTKLLKCYLKKNNAIEETGCDDRDSLINKRIELSGILLGGLFEQSFKKMISDCSKTFRIKNTQEKKTPNIINHIKSNTIEQGLRQALSTGNFGSKTRKGLSQMLNRLNHLHSLSSLRKIINPVSDTYKQTGPRHLHVSQWGTTCPLETPEGAKTGIVKNMAMLENISIGLNSQIYIIQDYLEGKIETLENINPIRLHTKYRIFLNGNMMGIETDEWPIRLIHNELRNLRFNGDIDKTVSFVDQFKDMEYHIYTDGGRTIRPYFTVNNNELEFKPSMLDNIKSWGEFMTKWPKVIEYLDKDEELNMMLALYPQDIADSKRIMNRQVITTRKEIDKINRTNRYDNNTFKLYSHCEIHPSMILGLISSNIPFTNHNQSPRGIYQYNQAKQAMGIYISDYRERIDISYILYHTQIPLINSRVSRYTGSHIFPAGENCIVSIQSYTGYNQEDSLLVNSTSIDRGLFRAQSLKKYYEIIKKNHSSTENSMFMKPDRNNVDGIKVCNYDKLNEQGYVPVETVVNDNDIIIGMVTPKTAIGPKDRQYKDDSVAYRSIVPGAIDKVILGHNNEGYPIMKVRVRSERIPDIGDKFCCYDETTEILTHRGWIQFNDLKINDKVASLTTNNQLTYQNPSQIQKYNYNGDMYYLKTNQLDLCVTPNHEMWVSKRLIENGNKVKVYTKEMAKQIIGQVRYYQKNVDSYLAPQHESNKFTIPAYKNTPAKKVDMLSWLLFFGIWLTQGCVSNGSVIISADKQQVKNVLLEVVPKMNYTIKSCKYHEADKITNRWEIHDIQLAHLIQNYKLGYDIDKPLPEWVWSLSTEQSRILIEGMLLANSHTTMRIYDTSSTKLADDFQRLCLHAGWSANKKLRENDGVVRKINGKTTNANTWRLTIVTTQNNPKVNKNKQMDKYIKYKGIVYCCTVPNGIVYVRRNGMVAWCGNSRSGQKGTVGYKPHRSDMPFSPTGLVPDIIVNPNAFPKRMTIGQLIECLMGKVCAVKGVYGDATAFTKIDIHKINDELVKLGLKSWGFETMYNGITGKKMENPIFIGPTYYQRLKQMVSDKVHARARGLMQMMTRQPTEGRSRDGGLRLGEMERDAICAHGCAQFLKEKLVDNSDIYRIQVCDICGMFASKVINEDNYTCKACQNNVNISTIVIPYAFKLLIQELKSIQILARIITSKSVTIPRG